MKGPLFALLLSMMGCSSSLKGQRTTSAADRAAPVEATYWCFNPLSFHADGFSIKELTPSTGLVLAKGGSGPILIGGENATTNHWQSPLGDHFFAWSSMGVGAETIVSTSRDGALDFLYSQQSADDGAYTTAESPDGTTRPSGTPMGVNTCIRKEVAEKLRDEGKPMLARVGARPLSAEMAKDKAELPVRTCSRNGAQSIPTNRPPLAGPIWIWMPTGFFFAPGGKSYVAFGNARLGIGKDWHVFEIDRDANGKFAFSLGAVSFSGWYAVSEGKSLAEISGTIASRPASELRCVYGL